MARTNRVLDLAVIIGIPVSTRVIIDFIVLANQKTSLHIYMSIHLNTQKHQCKKQQISFS